MSSQQMSRICSSPLKQKEFTGIHSSPTITRTTLKPVLHVHCLISKRASNDWRPFRQTQSRLPLFATTMFSSLTSNQDWKHKSQRMASEIKSSMAPPIGFTRRSLERTMVFFGHRTANSSLFTDSTNPVSRSFPCRCTANFTPSHTPSNTQKQEKTMHRSMSLSSIPKPAKNYPCSIQKQNTFRG